MAKLFNTPRNEKRQLKDLIPFPVQKDFFDDLSEEDLQVLADNIARNGLRHNIEVLPENKAGYPPNTILTGHQRLRALLLNDESEAEVIVRYDLAEADATEIEREFLEDNKDRRQLDALAKARVALRLFEIEQGKGRGKLSRCDDGEARDRVGRAIGMSGRNLQRYFLILKAPVDVQNAFRSQKLTLVEAGKVALLGNKDQEKVAARIQTGENPRAVLQDFLAPKPAHKRPLYRALASFSRESKRCVEDLDGELEYVTRAAVKEHLPVLEKVHAMLTQILAQAKKQEAHELHG